MENKQLTKNQRVTLDIVDLSYEGLGVAKVNGYSLFVENALPKEQVEAIVTKVGKKYGFAKAIKILKKSPDRVEKFDKRYVQTGIAPLIHLSYAKQLEFKQHQLAVDFSKFNLDIPVKTIVGADDPFEYRNKAQIPVRTINGKLTTGFFRRHSHDLVPLDNYLIQDPKIDAEINQVRDILANYNINGYDEAKNRGQIRNIMIRRGYYTGQMMVVLVATTDRIRKLPFIIKDIMKNSDVKSLFLNINAKKTNVILGKKYELLAGETYIEDKILGKTFRISPQSFYQINPKQTQKLYKLAIDAADLQGNEIVVDAYSGIGTIGISLADHAKEVYGIEVVKSAVKDAKINAAINGVDNAQFICGKTEDVLNKWAENDRKIDVLMVDPPRKGLDNSLIASINSLKPKKIVYISCNPATLARDVDLLKDTYQATESTPVDMFPMTNHVESVTTIVKK